MDEEKISVIFGKTRMNRIFLPIAACFALLVCSCTIPSDKPPPGEQEVYQVQDSLRRELLLRISHARMEINRQAEMMSRRAYSADKATARSLNQKIATIREAYEELEEKTAVLEQDSLMDRWMVTKQEADLILGRVSRTLQTPL